MDHETRMKRFRERIDKMATLDHATAALYYDAQTVMPRGGAEDFGKTAAELSGENYRLLTCPEMREDIDAILASPMEADLLALAEANELSEQLRRIERIPLDEYMEFERVRAKANSVWHEAKEQSDFALFAPLLKRVFDMTRRFAALYDPERDPYDNLLDEYGWSSSVPNLSGKLKRGSLRYGEAVELADALGYEIVWQRRKNDRA